MPRHCTCKTWRWRRKGCGDESCQIHRPAINSSAYIFENAAIIGKVTLSGDVSIWSGVVIRGDNDAIVVAKGSNVQEASVLHVNPESPLHIEPNVTVGRQAMLHGCAIGEGSLIGIGCIVLNKAKMGRICLVGVDAIVPEGREVLDGSLVIGVGKIARALSDEEIPGIHAWTANYVKKCRLYREGFVGLLDEGPQGGGEKSLRSQSELQDCRDSGLTLTLENYRLRTICAKNEKSLLTCIFRLSINQRRCKSFLSSSHLLGRSPTLPIRSRAKEPQSEATGWGSFLFVQRAK